MASTLILNAYDQNGQLVAQGDPGSLSVTLKGVAPANASNYQVAFEDGYGRLSPMVAVGPSASTSASGSSSAPASTSESASAPESASASGSSSAPASDSGSASH